MKGARRTEGHAYETVLDALLATTGRLLLALLVAFAIVLRVFVGFGARLYEVAAQFSSAGVESSVSRATIVARVVDRAVRNRREIPRRWEP